MRSIVPTLLLALSIPGLAGCAQRDAPVTDSVDDNQQGPTALTPGTRAVTIGEGGAGLAACIARGRITNLSPDSQPYLPVRAAPFAEALEVAQLHNGAHLFVCTRSIDQGWRGVILPPEDQPDADCGVRAPVAAVQPYRGPCRQGWVPAAFVEMGAD